MGNVSVALNHDKTNSRLNLMFSRLHRNPAIKSYQAETVIGKEQRALRKKIPIGPKFFLVFFVCCYTNSGGPIQVAKGFQESQLAIQVLSMQPYPLGGLSQVAIIIICIEQYDFRSLGQVSIQVFTLQGALQVAILLMCM